MPRPIITTDYTERTIPTSEHSTRLKLISIWQQTGNIWSFANYYPWQDDTEATAYNTRADINTSYN